LSKDRSPRQRFEKAAPSKGPQVPRRRLWPWFLAAFTLILAGGGTYAALRSPYLEVQQLTVSGTQTLDAAAIADLTGLQGKSILSLDLAAARERVLQIPQVRRVSFRREFPRKVTVTIDERQPWGFWAVGGRDYPIDVEGVVLIGGAPSSQYLRIVEPDSNRVMGPGDRVDPDAVAFADRISRQSPSALGQTVKSLDYQTGIGVTVVFVSGLRVTFGDDRAYEYKVAVLSQLLTQLKAANRVPYAVDLRFGERVTYE
jgi:cell division septal protein FtsQ